ncbi:ATP-dependent DNA ligase [soil metagenome]
MLAFSRLFAELDASTATSAKVDALKRYFAVAAAADAAWAVYFLAGGKPRQVVPTALLRVLACERAGIAEWLFEECYQAVGDLAETIAHVLPPAHALSDVGLAVWVEQRLLPLRNAAPAEQAARIAGYWDELDTAGRFLLIKLIGGGFRVGVSKLLVQRALAEVAGLDAKLVAQRLMGYTDAKSSPDASRYERLVSHADVGLADAGQPYPFFLAHALEAPLAEFDARLGPPSDWLIEWKYDGIRAQVVKRTGQVWIWSRGEELVTERFPEVVALAKPWPDGTVLDGEIVVWKHGAPAAFNLLQQRIGRKTLTKKVLADAPVGLIAYDLLEWQGADLREQPQSARRALLEAAIESTAEAARSALIAKVPGAAEQASSGSPDMPAIHLSPAETRATWAELAVLREASRERGVEGFMLKHRGARYGTGRTKADGTWWKWKIEPLSVDCVLIYAQAGHGRRASVYTDYTFAVWSRTPANAAEAQAVIDAIERREPAQPEALQLVAFAKAYSGLTDEEFRGVDRIIRQTTLEKFGPVRSVKPSLVFELGFEGINRSPRHKSGIAVRFPRMLRIRSDKPIHEADTLQSLEGLLALAGQ